MPPPNANGALHIGHAVFVTLQDIMIRFNRMRGKKALWLPGADHAGIETEYVYRKKLEKEGKRWSDFPRDELYRQIFEFTQTNKAVMENQLRKLGASCDWSREKFTLDPVIVEKVIDTFVKLYQDGFIYRGTRIINWSVKDQTALSDLEIAYEERSDPLYYIKYGPLELATVRPETKFGDTAVAVHPDDRRYKRYVGQEIEIETVLGPAKIKVIADKAVDPRFGTGVIKVTPAHDPADFEIGLRHNLEVRQVIDLHGRLNEKTGPYAGLKVEEARKKVAEDMRKKGLITRIDDTYRHSVAVSRRSGGVIEPMVMPQWFVATTKSSRRRKMKDERRKLGKSLRDMAVDAVKSGKIKIVPKRYEKIFYHWMKDLRDWNISRQITWGIRIPAWFCAPNQQLKKMGFYEGIVPQVLKGKSRTYRLNDHNYKVGDLIALENSQTKTLFGHAIIEKIERKKIKDIKLPDTIHGGGYKTLDELLPAFRRHYPPEREINENTEVIVYDFSFIPFSKKNPSGGCNYSVVGKEKPDRCPNCGNNKIVQDLDVLDTWFSSGQWPFLTLGYPDAKDFKEFYPTDVMETGWDIFFLWVARMVMLGLYRTGKVPFRTVYLHGLVRDKDRQKMSKSKGNVIDPLGVAELYGTDAVRMALVVGNTPGNDIIISEEKIRGYRNFANKIWNASRFVLLHASAAPDKKKITLGREEKVMLKKLSDAVKSVTKDIEQYRFHHAAEKLYHFFWHYYADKVIERMKPKLAAGNGTKEKETAKYVLLVFHSTLLKLLHPFMPFVTETVWSHMPMKDKKLLLVEKWPTT